MTPTEAVVAADTEATTTTEIATIGATTLREAGTPGEAVIARITIEAAEVVGMITDETAAAGTTDETTSMIGEVDIHQTSLTMMIDMTVMDKMILVVEWSGPS